MKKATLLLLTLLLCTLSAAALADETYAMVRGMFLDDRLNMWSDPEGAEPIAEFYNGTFVRVLDEYSDRWVRGRIGSENGGSITGYMLKKDFDYTCSTLPETPLMTINNTTGSDGINLRREPALYADKLAFLPNGSAVTVLGILPEWYMVQVGGLTGFVAKYAFDTDLSADRPALGELWSDWVQYPFGTAAMSETRPGVYSFTGIWDLDAMGLHHDAIAGCDVYANRQRICFIPAQETSPDVAIAICSIVDVVIEGDPYAFELHPIWVGDAAGQPDRWFTLLKDRGDDPHIIE